MANIIFTHLTSGSADSGSENLGDQNTASISANTSKLLLVYVASNKPSGTPNTPTISGFTQIATVLTSDNHIRGTLFRKVGATSGALTISHGGQNEQNIYWSVLTVENVDLDGVNGANAIVQSGTGNGIAQTNFLVTLGAFVTADNATFGCVYQNTSNGITPGSGFTELNEYNPGIHGIETEYKNSNDTSVDWSVGSISSYVAVAIELKFKNQAQDDYAYFM